MADWTADRTACKAAPARNGTGIELHRVALFAAYAFVAASILFL